MEVKISYGNGIGLKLNGETFLLDPKISDFTSFVSHAHFDHSPYEIIKKPYCTQETFELIKVRDPSFKANIVRKNEKIDFGKVSVEFINSGHMLGSAQILIETKDVSILYTGDFKLRESLSCESIEIRNADILIIESTFGLRSISFPSLEKIEEELISWIEKQLKEGYSINLGGYPLGKSQEIISILNRNKIYPKLSSTVEKYSEVYRKFGVKLNYGKDDEIFVKPINIVCSIKSSKWKSCVLTGWTLLRDFGTFGLPLSDHSDFNQILSFVKEVRPKVVYCVHGFVKELSSAIRKELGIKAFPLFKDNNFNEQKSLVEFKI